MTSESPLSRLRHVLDGVPQDGDPVETVRALLAVRAGVDGALAAAVDRARADGVTWQALGDVLGTTRQAAFQRFGHPIDPRTGAPMNTTPRPDAAEKTIAVFSLIAAGSWEQARADFDETVAAGLSAQQLADTWAQVVGSVGAFESAGEPRVRAMADFTVVDLPLHFEAGELVGRLSLDAAGRIAGLFVLPPAAAAEL
jgi:hypothetical protein